MSPVSGGDPHYNVVDGSDEEIFYGEGRTGV